MFLENLVKEAKNKLESLSGETNFFMEFKNFGDFSTSLPLKIARKQGKNPKELAESWASQIKIKGIEVKPKGGFINFFLTKEALIYNLNNLFDFKQSGKTVVIDYSSPNIAKPFSVGHLRSTIIGDSLRRMYTFLGWKTIGLNFYGDWGMQFGKILAAYQLWPTELDKNPIKNLYQLYVKFHEEVEKEKMTKILPEHIHLDKPKQKTPLEHLADEWFQKLESGNETAVKLWKKFRKLSLNEFERMYKVLGVPKLIDAGESKFVKSAQKLVNELLEKGIAKKEKGAIIVPIKENPPLILQKSDGTTIYSARDLAAGIWRNKKFNPDLMLYVVGSEQKLHFHQVFESLKKIGINTKSEHIDFGLVRLPEGKMSSRKGRVIFLEDVLSEATSRVESIMKERGDADQAVCSQVGIGAVKFNDLKNTRTHNILFTWDALKFEGETGPYVQYSAVRAKRIAEKFGKGSPGIDKTTLELARKLVNFRIVILKSIRQNRPDILANFTLDVSQSFNTLYVKEKFGGDKTREWIVNRTYVVLEKCLDLLGIKVPKKM